MRGYNERCQRHMVHNWKAAPTPLNPQLMRSVCGRAYAFRSVIKAEGGRQRCKDCEKKHPTVSDKS